MGAIDAHAAGPRVGRLLGVLYLHIVAPDAPPPMTTQRGPLAAGRYACLFVRPLIAAATAAIVEPAETFKNWRRLTLFGASRVCDIILYFPSR